MLLFFFLAYAGGYVQEMYHAIIAGNLAYLGRRSDMAEMRIVYRVASLVLLFVHVGLYALAYRKNKDSLNDFDFFFFVVVASSFAALILVGGMNAYFGGGFALYGLYGTYYLSRFSLKESHKTKVVIVSLSLLSLLAVPSLQLASFYGDWTRFGASTTYAMYDALDTIPEEAKKENNILGIGTYTAIYDMENVHFYHKFANDNDWWVGQIPGVQESLRELFLVKIDQRI